ncbi:MAG: PIN domain nuclease [Bacteroidetes bacterium CG12_big_fil_rev_8_21_14_0_65_60_17]|nr:MAG: PIN domain nuclease [Bacteroidetes bacterium CG12_big_fil_rev_8_21_14_0_65_60_17]
MIIDSNILIYSWTDEHAELLLFIRQNAPSVSVVTKIETLGYHLLSPDERIYLETFFEDAIVLGVTEAIADRAVTLRQRRKMSLGDSLIAATALIHDVPLVTHNLSDFSWVEGLKLLDPIR